MKVLKRVVKMVRWCDCRWRWAARARQAPTRFTRAWTTWTGSPVWPRKNCCTTRASGTTSTRFGLWSGASCHRRLGHLIYQRRVLPPTDSPPVICARGRGETTGIPFPSTALSVSGDTRSSFPFNHLQFSKLGQDIPSVRVNSKRIQESKLVRSNCPFHLPLLIKILCPSVFFRVISARWRY